MQGRRSAERQPAATHSLRTSQTLKSTAHKRTLHSLSQSTGENTARPLTALQRRIKAENGNGRPFRADNTHLTVGVDGGKADNIDMTVDLTRCPSALSLSPCHLCEGKRTSWMCLACVVNAV